MTRYRTLRPLGTGPDGPVEEVSSGQLGAATLARRRAPVPAGPRRHRLRDVSESLARLGHPGIATVVDIVDVDDDRVEVLTTIGPHGSLAERVTHGPLPSDEVRGILRALTGALAAAHGVGVAHGHLTTTNVVLRDGEPLLTDFGLTEARTGRPHAHPFRADVRDLAALGTELLGATPDPSADALRRVLHWVADDPDATLADLQRALDDRRTPPPPPPPPSPVAPAVPTRSGPGSRRTPWALAGIAVLVLGLLAGAASVLVPGENHPPDDVAAPVEEDRTCADVQSAFAADVDGDGCDDPVDWQASDAELAYPGAAGTLLRFRVGRPGDELVLGDWNCDGTATAGVVRAATGETFVFDAWASEGETLVAQPGPVLPAGAAVTVADDGGCDRIQPVRS